MNDLRDELLKTKRIYAMAIRENSLMRTKLKIAEKECKRREEEIENLLSNKNEQSTSRYEERIQLNSLRKKLLQYERALRIKNEENCQLLADRNILRASEAREMVVKLENECNRLRNHLSQSIPEAEYLREKQQYMHVIEKLTEENMELRKIIGEYEKRRKETEKKLEHLYGGMDLVKEFRNTGIATRYRLSSSSESNLDFSRKQANFYKSALTSLVQNWRNANSSTNGHHYSHHRNHHLLITKNRSNSESAVAARCLAEKTGGGRGKCESTPDSSSVENPMMMTPLHKHNSKSSLPIVSALTGILVFFTIAYN